MDRNQAKALLPIIQAYAEGKVIESRCIKGDTSLWYDDKDPSFDDDFEYRIKPEPKYRPFAKAEECWVEMCKPIRVTDEDNYYGWKDTFTEISLCNGCIKKLIGRDLSWSDEPVELNGK